MVRVLFAAAIAYSVISLAVLLPPALRQPWQESIPGLAMPFLIAYMLWFVAVIYKYRSTTRRPRTTRRALWFFGIIGLIGAAWIAGLNMLFRRADAESIIWISGCLLVGVCGIAAARRMPLAPSDGREGRARSPSG
jgi:hypothetical protein